MNLPRVGTQDNFFELGGHSLLVAQMTAQVCDVLGIDLPILSVFEAPTIADLALCVEELMRGQQGIDDDRDARAPYSRSVGQTNGMKGSGELPVG